jgi:hypothetical protein
MLCKSPQIFVVIKVFPHHIQVLLGKGELNHWEE